MTKTTPELWHSILKISPLQFCAWKTTGMFLMKKKYCVSTDICTLNVKITVSLKAGERDRVILTQHYKATRGLLTTEPRPSDEDDTRASTTLLTTTAVGEHRALIDLMRIGPSTQWVLSGTRT
ncbi:hypothetical protein TNCV_2816571 [Trichonephila clavipes]|nr:hypothetical protein TNCV_2816571 [Trichonephila clavipes]